MLIVTLLQKSIEELAMMTDGFMEMTEYPAPILRLARRKAEDVLDYLGRLEEVTSYEPRVTSEDAATPPVISNETNSFPQDIEPDAGLSPEGQNDEEAANHELQATSEEEVLEEAVTSEETSSPVQPPAAPHTDNTIADAHSMKKVDDIRQAISIGDQFRFQRELFAGNGELMHKTIAKLNQMGSLDEAMKYLQAKFSWNAEDEIVEHFLQIIRRRW